MFTKYLLTFLILNLNIGCAEDDSDTAYVENIAGANSIIKTDSSIGGSSSVDATVVGGSSSITQTTLNVGGTTTLNTNVGIGGEISGIGGDVGIGGTTYKVSTEYPDCDALATASANLPCDNKIDYICLRGSKLSNFPMYCHYSANTWVYTSCVNKGTLPGDICVPDLDLSPNNFVGNTCGWCICDTKTNTWLKNNNDYNRQTCF
jgi:hypothetical protein